MRSIRRQVLGVVLIAIVLASCSSSAKSATSASSTTSAASNGARSTTLPALPTTVPSNPDQQLNSIPYDVGALIGLPNGWRVIVTKVRRPFLAAGLPAVPAGQQYVCVDLTMTNGGSAPVAVHAHPIFTMSDDSGKSHPVVSGAAGAVGIDATYKPGASRSGYLVFVVPVGKHLQMILDGPAIGTQESDFTIDPPTVPQQG